MLAVETETLTPTRTKFWIAVAICVGVCLIVAVDEWRILQSVAVLAPDAPGLAPDRWIVGVCAALMTALAIMAFRRGGAGSAATFFIGAICGAGFFACSIGTAILDPTAVGWLLRGEDWTTHYGGWAMFRNTPWTWPPGALPNLMYPRGTAIVFTDSLPLLALLCKVFSAWLPATFQYTGLWFALCCLLQGGFGALLAQRWTRHPAVIVAVAAFFLYAPVFLNRMPHATLMGHWLILASLWLYFRPNPPLTIRKEMWPWWIVVATAALTMPYLAAMSMAILFAYCVRRCWVDRERSLREAALMLVSALAVVFAMWWISDAFILKFMYGNGGVSHGIYSFNLDGFFNSFGWSMLLPGLPVTSSAQLEGYAYLGFGVIALLAVLLAEAIVQRRRPQWPRRHWPLLAAALATTAFAASTVLTLGAWTLIDLPQTTPLLSTFRGSGRFIWVAYYLTVLAVMAFTVKRFGSTAAGVLLGCALAVQAWDTVRSHQHVAHLRDGLNWPAPMKSLDDPAWDELAAHRQHLTLLPPAPCGLAPGPVLPFQLVAARNRLTFNTAYVARWNPDADELYCRQLEDQLKRGDMRGDELYVVSDEWKERFGQAAKSPTCRMLDGFRACVVDEASPP
jgi:hypothetical protein